MTRRALTVLAASAVLGAACGGSVATSPDAGSGAGDAGGDGSAGASYPACREFATPGVALPAHVTGALMGADVEAPAQCATIDAAFGVESAGPDSVVRVIGLVPGTTYDVHLLSDADLGFYVATGCDTPTGPSSSECLLFEDASPGHSEFGSFVAQGTEAYIIVDFYQSTPPRDPTFTLDVYREECSSDGDHDDPDCTGATPACVDGRCVACATSFDCPTAALPVCDTDAHTCVASGGGCTADDASEPADDGPAGARALVLDGGGSGSVDGLICSAPNGESDFVSFQIASIGETWDLQLAWPGNRVFALELYDAFGAPIGLSAWEQPQRVRLTFLPVGTYYAQVTELTNTSDATPVPYTLSAQRTLGAGCTSSADCAAEFRNQVFRGTCSAGACVSIDGDGLVAQGGACDSQSDCAAGLACPSFFFVADSDTRERCEPTCDHDQDCAAIGPDYVCTTYLAVNQCVPRCTDDLQCPTEIDALPISGPWSRLSCDRPSGRCLP